MVEITTQSHEKDRDSGIFQVNLGLREAPGEVLGVYHECGVDEIVEGDHSRYVDEHWAAVFVNEEHLKGPFKEMDGKCRFNQNKPETMVWEKAERGKAKEKCWEIHHEHAFPSRNFEGRFLGPNVPKFGVLQLVSSDFSYPIVP